MVRIENIRIRKEDVKGSYGQHFLGLVLEEAGLTFDDIEQVNLPNADIGNAVASEQVDAGIIWEPGLSSTLSTGKIKILLDGTGIKSNNVFFFSNADFAQNNPDGLLGHSGCGKSTLLRIIAGLEKDYEGEAFIDGQKIQGASLDKGLVFQEHRLFPWFINIRISFPEACHSVLPLRGL